MNIDGAVENFVTDRRAKLQVEIVAAMISSGIVTYGTAFRKKNPSDSGRADQNFVPRPAPIRPVDASRRSPASGRARTRHPSSMK
ncbi:MAG: hypothetical protein LIQ31_13290 [Planctomycetes bacterium]|nr:hypothetical protein [Planctomycetota bacterium]